MPLGEPIHIGTKSPYLSLRLYRGHFATAHAHMNYYIDIASNKASLKEAEAVAQALAVHYRMSAPVETILCLDGMEVIGACLARELTRTDPYNVNADGDVFVLTPERNADGQLFFRDNTSPMITGRPVLILAASVVTGYTAASAVEAIRYYGGVPVGICSIFAKVTECEGIPVHSVFDPNDMQGYMTSPAVSCPMCRNGEKITALVNSYGCSAL